MTRRWWLAGTVAALVACGAPQSPAAPATVSEVRARVEVYCLDVTTSVPAASVTAIQQVVADRIAASVPTDVDAPSGAFVGHLRRTDAESYSADAAVLDVDVDAVPKPPAATPTSGNPYERRADEDAAAAHTVALAGWRAERDATAARARAEADRVRAADLGRDDRGTDVLGCVLKAAELLATDPDARRFLLVFGDLRPDGRQEDGVPALDGVEVLVVFRCADDATTCSGRRTAFTDRLARARAAVVEVVDPSQLT